MSCFKWRTADEEPPDGKGRYIVIGKKGGIYLAYRYARINVGDSDLSWFVVNGGRHLYKGDFKAWAEVPEFDGGAE